jgi:beta-lactamase class A
MNRGAFLAGGIALAIPSGARAATLSDAIVAAAAASSGTVGVYARSMGLGPARVSYNAEVVFPAASTIKLLILVTLYARADGDPALLDRKIVPRASDRVGDSPTVDAAPDGTAFSVKTLAHAMITQSDNSAANTLITLLGFEAINATAATYGLGHTQLKRHFLDWGAIVRHSNNLTCPRDLGYLLYLIERGAREGIPTVAKPQSCRKMIGILLQQEDREKIAGGLPPGTPLANKTGEITGVRSDVGVVDPYGDTPYVLAILTKDLTNYDQGVEAIRKITRAVNGVL